MVFPHRYAGNAFKLLLIAACVAVSSCEFPPASFTEYEGVNLLGDQGFSDTRWTPDQGSTYMRFEPVADTTATAVGLPTGLTAEDPGASIYRLEIRNLIPNGDFEDPAVTGAPDGWSIVDVDPTGSVTLAVGSSGSLSGKRELHIAHDKNDAVYLDLSAPSGVSRDGMVEGGDYAIRFRFDPSEQLNYRFSLQTGAGDIPPWEAEVLLEDRDYEFPADFADVTSRFTVMSATTRFVLTDQKQELEIDDLRLVRTDIPSAVRMLLPYSDETRPDLISGWYTFSFYVHADPTVGDVEVPGHRNRYPANALTYAINSTEYAVAYVDPSDPDPPDRHYSSDRWYQVQTEVHLQTVETDDPSTTVIELVLVPTDIVSSNSHDVGSLLICSPSLTFSPRSP